MMVKLPIPQFQRKVGFVCSDWWPRWEGRDSCREEVQSCIPSAPVNLWLKQSPSVGNQIQSELRFLMRVRNILRGVRNTPAGLWANFAWGGLVSLNPVFGKCLDLPQAKYPGMWKASVPLPLGCTGRAGCVTARAKFVGRHPVDGDGTRARTTLPKQSLGSAGRRKPKRLNYAPKEK